MIDDDDDPNVLWTTKYRPKTTNELTIPAAKLAQLRDAFLHQNIVVVEGPSGSGKLSAVKVITKELGYTISEWDIRPFGLGLATLTDTFIKFLTCRSIPIHCGTPSSSSLATASFPKVFSPTPFTPVSLHENRYAIPVLQVDVNNKRSEHGSHALVIKDFPHSLLHQSWQGNDRLKIFSRLKAVIEFLNSTVKGTNLVIFIFGDSAADRHTVHSLFLQQSFQIPHVKILAPSTTSIKKVAKRVLLSQGKFCFLREVRGNGHLLLGVPPATVKGILSNLTVLQNANDITSLLNYLQFFIIPQCYQAYCVHQGSRGRNTIKAGGGLGVAALEDNPGFLKDPKDGIMHAVGRLLYNKRIPQQNPQRMREKLLSSATPGRMSDISQDSVREHKDVAFYIPLMTSPCWEAPKSKKTGDPEQLPASQLYPKLLRSRLYYNPDELLEGLIPDLHTVVDLVYSNFPHFYNSIADAAEVLDQFVFADSYLGRRPQGREMIQDLDSVRHIICCKAILDSNLHPTSPGKEETAVQLPTSPLVNLNDDTVVTLESSLMPMDEVGQLLDELLPLPNSEIVQKQHKQSSTTRVLQSIQYQQRSRASQLFKFQKSKLSDIKARQEASRRTIVAEFFRTTRILERYPPLPPSSSSSSALGIYYSALLNNSVCTELLQWLPTLSNSDVHQRQRMVMMRRHHCSSYHYRHDFVPFSAALTTRVTAMPTDNNSLHELEIDEADLEPPMDDDIEYVPF